MRRCRAGVREKNSRLLTFRPNPNVSVHFDMNVDDIRAATDRTIFDVFLLGTRSQVHPHNDFFTTGVTDIGGFVLHCLSFHSLDDAQFRVRWNDSSKNL